MGLWDRFPAGLVITGRDGRPLLRLGAPPEAADAGPSDDVDLPPHADLLTGLPNRAGFMQAAVREDARIRRSGKPSCVAVIDLDGFKEINDRYGHGGGDAVLKEVTRTVDGFCREADLVARAGGDELWILLPSTEVDDAVAMLECLSVAITDQVRLPDGTGVTASTGVARLGRDRNGAKAAVEHAATAAHAAKVPTPGQVVAAKQGLFASLRSEWADLQRDSLVDERTGLANPRAFEADWNQLHASGDTYGLVLIDLDHFHSYNRQHGIRAGDETLAVVAAAMEQTLGGAGRLYRYGGEEFAALVDASENPLDEVGHAMVQSVRELQRQHDGRPDGRGCVTVTAAGALVNPDRHDRMARFDRVDQTMVEAKGAGRDRYATVVDGRSGPQ